MSNQYPSWWTQERIEELKTRWHNRETAGEIARIMHAKSRNAIIGKARRLNLEVRATIHNNGVKRTTGTRTKPRRALIYCDGRYRKGKEIEVIDEPPPDFQTAKSIMALDHDDCRWPGTGCGADMLYCAAPVAPGYSYCPAHCRIAY